MTENLWVRSIKDYWSDPKKVFASAGTLTRRIVKFLWLVLAIYVLFWIAGPSQVASWQLWMQDDELAAHIAWGFTYAGALGFAVVSYVAEATAPIRLPVPFPVRLWPLDQWRWAHLHIPNVRVMLGSTLIMAVFVIALLSQWNYYLHDNLATSGTSVAAAQGSTSRVTEAERALAEHDQSTASALALIDQAIAETSAGSPTGRSRLVAQRTTLMTEAGQERRRLQEELRAAREEIVQTRATTSDPRPVDGWVATATGLDRSLVSSLLDLLRSAVVEALLVLGPGLGLAGGLSRIGVREEREPVAPPLSEEIVEAVDVPPPQFDPPPSPEPRRYVLPTATEDDLREAASIGPHRPPEPEPTPEPAQEPAEQGPPQRQAEADGEDDPLVREMMETENA